MQSGPRGRKAWNRSPKAARRISHELGITLAQQGRLTWHVNNCIKFPLSVFIVHYPVYVAGRLRGSEWPWGGSSLPPHFWFWLRFLCCCDVLSSDEGLPLGMVGRCELEKAEQTSCVRQGARCRLSHGRSLIYYLTLQDQMPR